MGFLSMARILSIRAIFTVFSLTVAVSTIIPAGILYAQNEQAINATFIEVTRMRSRGEFDQAVETLKKIIQDYTDSDQVIRQAYNQLIYTLDYRGDSESMRVYARIALERFPDLMVTEEESDYVDPLRLNPTYDQLRKEMFGAVRIDEPEGCRVLIDGIQVGETPYFEPLVRAGVHKLVLTKSGFYDLEQRLLVDPGGNHPVVASAMQRQRDKWWWIYRVGPALVGSAVLTYSLTRDSGNPVAPDEPLPGPPAPPTN
jgi:uncharacterized protein (UPF0147 family)